MSAHHFLSYIAGMLSMQSLSTYCCPLDGPASQAPCIPSAPCTERPAPRIPSVLLHRIDTSRPPGSNCALGRGLAISTAAGGHQLSSLTRPELPTAFPISSLQLHRHAANRSRSGSSFICVTRRLRSPTGEGRNCNIQFIFHQRACEREEVCPPAPSHIGPTLVPLHHTRHSTARLLPLYIPFYPFLSYPIPSYHILSHPIRSNLSYPI